MSPASPSDVSRLARSSLSSSVSLRVSRYLGATRRRSCSSKEQESGSVDPVANHSGQCAALHRPDHVVNLHRPAVVLARQLFEYVLHVISKSMCL